MTLYDRVADLPLSIDDDDLSLRERETSSDFTRVTTVVALSGDGETGYGEDVTYDADEHHALADWDGRFPLAGTYEFDGFSETIGDLDLFPASDPEREGFRHYRRWAFESAALDLALKQEGRTLAEAFDRSYEPVRFVASTRLGDPPTVDRIDRLLDSNPDLEFKLDPTSDWDPDLIERLADTGRVRILDLKGQYEGTEVDQPPDAALYEQVIEAFPDALIEDPKLTDETRPLFEGHEERVTWDYPITGVASVEALPWEPAWLNIKPSRFGSVRSLLDTLDYCRERGIDMFGGGQFELDGGREQLHALASLFYPDSPNDVAPSGYNDPEPAAGLPTSPLEPPADGRGLRWSDGD